MGASQLLFKLLVLLPLNNIYYYEKQSYDIQIIVISVIGAWNFAGEGVKSISGYLCEADSIETRKLGSYISQVFLQVAGLLELSVVLVDV